MLSVLIVMIHDKNHYEGLILYEVSACLVFQTV